MHSRTDLLLDALSAAVAAVATALVLDRLEVARRAAEATRTQRPLRRPPLPARLTESAVGLVVFRGAMGGTRAALRALI